MYFKDCKTVEEVKSLFRTLAKQHHPDLGGNLRIMQAINVEYHATLLRMNGQTRVEDDGKEYQYKYDRDIEQKIMDKIMELLKFQLPNVEIWLIGRWVWIMGDTKPVKDKLKGAGCIWHSKRKCWYWKPSELKRSRASRGSLRDIAFRYGATMFENEREGNVTA